jgi:hypothetical protein
MQRSTGAGPDLVCIGSIWEPVRFGALATGATATARAEAKRSGFERAAEAPLGARE